MSHMCVVAVEMGCLPNFFNHVSAKQHIAATFRSRETRESKQKTD